MRKFWIVPLLVLFGCQPAAEQASPAAESTEEASENEAAPRIYEKEGDVDGISYRIRFETLEWDPSRHSIGGSPEGIENVDGRWPYGLQGSAPDDEIVAMSVEWDGQEIDIPERYWSDCFNPFPDAEPEADQITIPVPTEDGGLILNMVLGSGSARYAVSWKLQMNGRHERRLAEDQASIDDMNAANFEVRPLDEEIWKFAEILR
jgi:hypothetical protein